MGSNREAVQSVTETCKGKAKNQSLHAALSGFSPFWMHQISKSISADLCQHNNTSFTAFILDRESQIQDVFCWQIDLSTFSPRVSAVGGKKPHHNANLFKDQLLCQDDSADDILESFNELTIVRNGDDEVAEVKMCASACARLCVCSDIYHSAGGI